MLFDSIIQHFLTVVNGYITIGKYINTSILLIAINPLITGLIEEGIAQGIRSTEYPAEVAEMVLLYSNTAFEDLAELSSDERQKKITAFIYNLERLLGMERGSLYEVILPLFQKSSYQKSGN